MVHQIRHLLASRRDPERHCFSVFVKRPNGDLCRVRLNIDKLCHYIHQRQQQLNAIGANPNDQWKPNDSVHRENKARFPNGNTLMNDVWVECQYRNIEKKTIFYFRSIRTNRCVLWDAPSGAGVVICHTDLGQFPFLKAFASQPLDREGRQIETGDYGDSKFHFSGGFISLRQARLRKLRLRELEMIQQIENGEAQPSQGNGWRRTFRWKRNLKTTPADS